jgi:hypothetical protein
VCEYCVKGRRCAKKIVVRKVEKEKFRIVVTLNELWWSSIAPSPFTPRQLFYMSRYRCNVFGD